MKIQAARARTEALALTRPYTIANATISAVEISVVELRAGGLVGFGAASPAEFVTGESDAACRDALAELEWLVGRDVRALPQLGRELARRMPATPAARAAVDIALHDLLAKKLDVPLVEMLGRAHDALPTSITIGIKSTEAALEEAREYLERGFRVLKIKLGHALEEDIERVTKLRELTGAGVTLRVDPNQGYTPASLMRFVERTSALDIEFLEQPMPARDVAAVRALPAALRARVAADESMHDERDALELVRPGPACGIFNIKLMKCGGVQPACGIARIAELAGVRLMWGCMDESRISIAAALHAALASPATRYLDLDGSFDLERDVVSGGFTVQDGILRTLDAPGLGVTALLMAAPELKRSLGLTSAISIVLGGVIGSGIFLKPLDVATNLPSVSWIFACWIGLGVVCLFGAFAYAELGAMLPEAGGQYAFLREGWGRFPAFLYGWCLFLVINTGTMAALAVAFARSLASVVPLSASAEIAVAAAMILGLAVVNHLGVGAGAVLQNLSSFAKLAALGAIVLGGFLSTAHVAPALPLAATPASPDLASGLVVAAMAIFWAYEGWYLLPFSAAELRDPERTLPRGLIYGTLALIVVYVAVNAAYLRVVPFAEMRTLQNDIDVPLLAIERMLGGPSGNVFALLLCLSVIGAANPNLLSTPRAFYAMAQDGLWFRAMMRVHPTFRTPTVAIWSQALWAVALVVVLETFRDITEFVIFAALLFYALTVAAVFVLRRKMPERARPYSCWGYPWAPALFIAVVLFVDLRTLMDPVSRKNSLLGLLILAAGALVYGVMRWRARRVQ